LTWPFASVVPMPLPGFAPVIVQRNRDAGAERAVGELDRRD